MRVGYVDTSCLVSVAFGEVGWRDLAGRLDDLDELFASNLLEAELRSAFVREEVEGPGDLLSRVSWVMPHRPLSDELERVLSAGYARGAHAWHLATALYLADVPAELPFLTLDGRQREVAERLGFPTPV